ncbi:MAG: hypothetical protein L6R39_004007 [Caloplaca ligustica]|nr:MAG: hypothetical protein L6R39_004007 [Caloplaca ligustica]
MHKLVRQLLDRFDPVSLAPADEIPPYSSDPGDDEHILMLSANDAAALIRSLFPSVSSSTASATPSTTGSSTLVSESMHDGERDKSTAASTSGISNARTTTVPFGTPQPWLDYGRASETAGNEQAPLLPGDNGIPSRDLRHRLSRVFDCLTSLALPEAKGPAAISAIDWALFGTTAHGKVRKPHALKSSKMQHHVALDGPGPVSDSVTGSVDALHLCIIQLLEQEDLNHVAFRPAADAAVNGLQETSGILEDLMRAAAHRAMADYDYQAMHYWWRMQRLLRISEGPSESLLQTIYNDGHESIKVHNHVSAGIQKQLYTLSCLRRAQVDRFQREQERRKALRMKMWYASDVRHSSPFEDALHVTQALRAMANTPRSKHSSGVANWARQRLKNVSWHDRSTAQTVEALTEPNEYSGTCKLNDDQVERTSRWLTRHSIENFCRGEERIQRFCFEVQKCVNKLTGPTLLESPVLWSSRLFEGERRSSDRKTTNTRGRGFEDSVGSSSGAPHWSSYGHLPYPPKGAQSVVNNTSKSSPILYGSSPKEPVRSLPFHTFNAPSMTPDSAWPSNSPAYGSKDETLPSKADGVRGLFTAGIKKDLFSLILSDLGYLLWHEGTETDAWVKFGSLNDDLTSPGYRHADPKPAPEVFDERHMQEPQDSRSAKGDLKLLLVEGTSAFQDPNSRWRIKDPIDASAVDDVLVLRSDQDQSPIFPFRQTYKSILERFSLSQDPQAKLRLLHELEKLVAHSIQQSLSASSSTPPSFKPNIATSLSRSQSILVPRTKATSFEEVIANCTERRAGTMRINKKPTSPWTSPDVGSFGTDEIVNTFLSIFQDLDLRPSTLFRDLQYIAAFVPAEILDQTPQGKAFWDAGLAALALKQELCDAMVSRATDITNYHISTSGPNPPPPFSPLHYNSLALTTLQDAAHLWIIAAKEGSATAARELGLLYLTHPEILPRTTLQPFSKPKEVFRMVGARKEGVHAAMEEGRLDPVTFAVVFHWMEVAASAGDRDARDFLRGNGEWGMGR